MKKKKITSLIDKVTHFFGGERCDRYGLVDQLRIIDRIKSTNGIKDWSIINAGLDKLSYKGQGELISILDTGVDKNHKDLTGRVEFIDLLADNIGTKLHEHGTFVAGEVLANGEIIGVAPMATGLCYRVLYGDTRDGSVLNFEQTLCNAICDSCKRGCGVISMSIGFTHKSHLVERALLEATNNGVIPVAACGNDGMIGSLFRSYPASYTSCISVAAANEKGMPNWFSSTGTGEIPEEQPEIAVASKEFYWGCLPDNQYGRMQGTSQACPIIAGTALLWREAMNKKGLLPNGNNVLKCFRNWLKTVSIDTNMNGWDSSLGWGVLSVKNNLL